MGAFTSTASATSRSAPNAKKRRKRSSTNSRKPRRKSRKRKSPTPPRPRGKNPLKEIRREKTGSKEAGRKTQTAAVKRHRLRFVGYARGCAVNTKSITLRIALIFIAVRALPAIVSAQSQPSTTVALTHAKIFTLAGSTIEDGTVVFRDGKITAVGAGIDIPAGAQVYNAKGLQVYPGIFDSITQMGLREIGAVSATVDSTETGSYNPDVVAATAVSPSSEHIPVTRAAGITEVLAVPGSGGFDSNGSGGVIGGQASAIHLTGWTIDEMLIKKSAAMVLNWPEIERYTFDFATFSRKEKPYSEAKHDYDKQVNEITDWIERARHYAQAMEKGSAARYDRDLKLESFVPVVRG